MPSGFQQDQNQLTPGFYRVVLTLNGGTATYPSVANSNSTTASGGVYVQDWSYFTTLPTTQNYSNCLSQGNLRWQAIIEELEKIADAQILDVVVTSADTSVANNQPTQISFTVKYDRDAFVLPAVQAILLQANPSNTTFLGYDNSTTITTTARAVRQLVTTGITRGGSTGYVRSYRVYNVAGNAENQQNVTIRQPDTPANVFADVAVTQIAGTTLI